MKRQPKREQAVDYYYRAYHDRREITHLFHRRKIDRVFRLVREGEAVLDVGCGPGVLLNLLESRRACRVTGLDIRREHVALARRICRSGKFLVGDAREFHLRAAFDCVCCLDLVEHFEPRDLDRTLERLARHVKPGGRLILTHPTGFYIRVVDPVWQRVRRALHPDIRFDDEVHRRVRGGRLAERARAEGMSPRRRALCNLGLIRIWVFAKEGPDARPGAADL